MTQKFFVFLLTRVPPLTFAAVRLTAFFANQLFLTLLSFPTSHILDFCSETNSKRRQVPLLLLLLLLLLSALCVFFQLVIIFSNFLHLPSMSELPKDTDYWKKSNSSLLLLLILLLLSLLQVSCLCSCSLSSKFPPNAPDLPPPSFPSYAHALPPPSFLLMLLLSLLQVVESAPVTTIKSADGIAYI